MKFTDMLRDATAQNNSLLCVAWTRTTRFPRGHAGDPRKIYDFCAAIVDATADLVCLQAADRLLCRARRRGPARTPDAAHARQRPQVPVILDAKRGDIGSTAEQYAREAFERYGADAVTLSPFMGFDSISPIWRTTGRARFAVPHVQPRW